MSIHIWCPRPSESACLLRDAIRAAGVRCYKTRPISGDRRAVMRFASRVKRGDVWLNWGPRPNWEADRMAGWFDMPTAEITILNNARTVGKRDQLIALYRGGVLVPEVYDAPGEGRIGRSAYHQEGRDLLSGGGRDYYVQRLNLSHEFRVHVFRGKSIRTGIKVPRVDNPHPWVRSYTGGWRLDYGRACQAAISNRVRDIARRAVEVLGLDFGAVDVGLIAGPSPKTPVVLEVNLAPGLDEGPSVQAYVRHILEVHNAGR